MAQAGSTTSTALVEPPAVPPGLPFDEATLGVGPGGRCGRQAPRVSDPFQQPTGFQQVRLQVPEDLSSLIRGLPGGNGQAEWLRDLHRTDPESARRLVHAFSAMPQAGTEFLGFYLVEELGRGALGRAFLARQGVLADRLVVLKIAPDIDGESRNLAQLQHTNVVPIYSVHHCGSLQVICMPYFGSTTLATVLRNLQGLESLPESGRELVATLVDRKSTTRRTESALSSTATAAPAEPTPPAVVEPSAPATPSVTDTDPTPVLKMLGELTYVDAILWIGCRLAAGLAHAHERGILHRDLKPANILLTDEGQPMLLDFNLSQDTKVRASASAALVGGTLPYMAPEQLRAYRDQTCVLTATSDLYALGVILYELLTGRHPFPVRTGELKHVLDQMIEDRRQPPPNVRTINPGVSPAVASIVRHCLEPDPARRYQSARELEDDLQRQRDNQPLRHAPEASLGERVRKWTRRHPRLASGTTVTLCAAVLLVGLMAGFVARGRQLAQTRAAETLAQFHEDKQTIPCRLITPSADVVQFERALTECRQLLGRYQVLDNPSWQDLPAVRDLSTEEQARLREELGDLLFVYSLALTQQARDYPDHPERAARLRLARHAHERAASCFDGKRSSRALRMLQAELSRVEGQSERAKKEFAEAETLPMQTAQDYYLTAGVEAARGQVRQAIPHLRQALEQDPRHYWAWFLLGLCHDSLAQDAEAAACYSTCIALWPDLPWAYYNRGLTAMRQFDYKQARADFHEAIRLRPEPLFHIQRALAEEGLKHYPETIRDLDRALELGASPARIYFLRAEARRLAGDAAGAARDREAGLREQPGDSLDWLARGCARLHEDPTAALDDFNNVLQLDPRSLTALQNKANILSRLNRTEEALEVLNREIELYPDYVFARSGRSVLLARQGKRQAAQADAEECLKRDRQPLLLYQLAGTYALTSPQHPEDRQRALRLLSAALQRGCGFDYLEGDADLNPIRNDREFRDVVAATRAIRAAGSAKP